MESIGVLTNKNVIPYDPESPMITSGLRFGVSGVTSRGMGKKEVVQIAKIIDAALSEKDKKDVLSHLADEVFDICKRFPVFI